ncbi:MAG: thermonuclease family protein [Rhodospirillales bacterium]
MAVQAQAASCDLADGHPGRVVAITDGDTLELDDGRVVRLVALQAPKLPLGRPGFRAWPLGEESRELLGRLTLDRTLRLAYGGVRTDRYDRDLAHLFDRDGRWIQQEMIRAGMARFYSFPDNRACAAELLAAEREARSRRLGIWRHPFYYIRQHDDLRNDIGSFQIVEGRVLQTADVRGRVYLNFGADYRTDFTVSLSPRVANMFRKLSIDPLAYQDREIRVRGWIKKRNGALIEVTHPEQIELMDQEPASSQ